MRSLFSQADSEVAMSFWNVGFDVARAIIWDFKLSLYQEVSFIPPDSDVDTHLACSLLIT
jgi:hypothetical protein